MLKRLAYLWRIFTLKPARYRNLLKTIYRERCRKIMEIGTFNGKHALMMIETAAIFSPVDQIEYYGFDLFENLTDEDLKKEFSKKPPSLEIVEKNLKNSDRTWMYWH